MYEAYFIYMPCALYGIKQMKIVSNKENYLTYV